MNVERFIRTCAMELWLFTFLTLLASSTTNISGNCDENAIDKRRFSETVTQ